MTDREAFEVWDRKVFGLPDMYYKPLYEGDFPSIEVKARWLTWQAATAHEREQCAKVCIEWADAHAKDTGECSYENCDFVAAAMDCADVIRKGE